MKKAFTMLELIFVLIVIGILAAIISPEMKSNKIREAAIQLISHIRYTQHLAMIDDKFDSVDSDWYKERWQLIFGSSATYTEGKIAYTIFSDKENGATLPNGNPNTTNDELARDPMNLDGFLSGGFAGSLYTSDIRANKKMNLGVSYNILDVDFTGGCSNARMIAFDHLGRPFFGPLTGTTNPYDNVMAQDCNISICTVSDCTTVPNGDSKVTITVESETGYAHIL